MPQVILSFLNRVGEQNVLVYFNLVLVFISPVENGKKMGKGLKVIIDFYCRWYYR